MSQSWAGPDLRRLPGADLSAVTLRQPQGAAVPGRVGDPPNPSWNESGGRMSLVMLGLSRTEDESSLYKHSLWVPDPPAPWRGCCTSWDVPEKSLLLWALVPLSGGCGGTQLLAGNASVVFSRLPALASSCLSPAGRKASLENFCPLGQ